MISTHINGNFAGNYTSIDKVPEGKEIASILKPEEMSFKATWNGTEWIEGTTQEEIDAKTASALLQELTEVCIYLTNRSLISSVNKEGDEVFLRGQVDRYKEKTKVARQFLIDGTIISQEWYDAIVTELANTNTLLGAGLDLPTFMGLIVQYYDTGEMRSKKFESAIEIFRCKTKDLITIGDFSRARSCLDLGKTLPLQLSLDDLDSFLVQFDGI